MMQTCIAGVLNLWYADPNPVVRKKFMNYNSNLTITHDIRVEISKIQFEAVFILSLKEEGNIEYHVLQKSRLHRFQRVFVFYFGSIFYATSLQKIGYGALKRVFR
uniref:Uncharacterized protein n=1 Tax=Cacopsylla melanoneura TaxID=428564 RepID=A0A8D9DR05_9HEMI